MSATCRGPSRSNTGTPTSSTAGRRISLAHSDLSLLLATKVGKRRRTSPGQARPIRRRPWMWERRSGKRWRNRRWCMCGTFLRRPANWVMPQKPGVQHSISGWGWQLVRACARDWNQQQAPRCEHRVLAVIEYNYEHDGELIVLRGQGLLDTCKMRTVQAMYGSACCEAKPTRPISAPSKTALDASSATAASSYSNGANLSRRESA